MSSKLKKVESTWYKCERCRANIVPKDSDVHADNCPPSISNFTHPLVLNNTLYGTLEVKENEEIKGILTRDKNNFIFLSQSAIELCNLVIGEWAVLKTTNMKIAPCARIVWPTKDKLVSSVLVTQTAYETTWKNKANINVAVSRLNTSTTREAGQVIIVIQNAPKTLQITNELIVRIRNTYLNRYVMKDNIIGVLFYGKLLEFLVKDITSSSVKSDLNLDNVARSLEGEFEELSVSEEFHFHKITNSTVFKTFSTEKEYVNTVKREDLIANIGGLKEEVEEVQDLVNVATGKLRRVPGMRFERGILLYGSPGTGKTMITRAIASASQCHVVFINGCTLHSTSKGEIEDKLNDCFQEAIDRAPSIIVLDDMDVLCPARATKNDAEKRIISTLLTQLDGLQALEDCSVCVLATSSNPDNIDRVFRRCGRLDREIEIPIPSPRDRLEILQKHLAQTKHSVDEDSLREIANSAHGFVGSDLVSLCSRSMMHALKRRDADVRIGVEDFRFALSRVRPSAMREVQIEVPDVKWSDVGGQHRLKLVLRQAVEWPLRHPESFTRLGITAPKGVLMFGPPGCSKTMIAKALATESGLNFLSIKGPELFSKWVGESERAIREVFRKARQVAPSVVFFDEIDALGGERGNSSSGGGAGVQERVLAQLLTELDGVTPLGEVSVLAATNRPDRIDKALVRPGRLDRIVYVPLPDDDTRREIFCIKLAKMPVKNVDIDNLVNKTAGYSGAEIQAICHEAAMKALEENICADCVTEAHFNDALTIVTPRTPASLLDIYRNYNNH